MSSDVRRSKLLFLVTEDWYFCSHRLALGRAAVAAGYEVTVATRVRHHADTIRGAGISLVPLPWTRKSANPWRELRTVWKLWRLYRRERPDLVHHVALKPVLYGSFAARLAGTQRVINAVAGFGYSFVAEGKRAAVARRIIQASFRRLSNRAHARVLVQNPDDERVLRETGTVEPGRLVVIPGSGVDVEHFAPSAEPEGIVRFTLVSRMLWSKGIGEFVEAARILRQRGVEFDPVLVGDPDPENPQSVRESKLRRWQADGAVSWRGHSDDVRAVWARSHVAVLPSHREGLPRTLLEAAACGRPLIATDVPGCREIVVDGENGLLVPVDEPQALADAMERLAADAALRHRMGRAAREIVMEKFSESVVLENVLSFYRSLLEED